MSAPVPQPWDQPPDDRLATPRRRGAMSKEDKARLDGLATITTVATPLTLTSGTLDIQQASATLEGSMSAAQYALVAQLSTVAAWVAVGSGGSAPAFAANWSNFGGTQQTCAYMKDANGRVWIRGTVKKAAAIALPDTIFTLPATGGFRPTTEKIVVGSANGGVFTEFRVQTGGAFLINVGGHVTYTAFEISFDPAV